MPTTTPTSVYPSSNHFADYMQRLSRCLIFEFSATELHFDMTWATLCISADQPEPDSPKKQVRHNSQLNNVAGHLIQSLNSFQLERAHNITQTPDKRLFFKQFVFFSFSNHSTISAERGPEDICVLSDGPPGKVAEQVGL